VADEKSYLRAVLSEARSSLFAARAAASSQLVQERLLATQAYRDASKIVLYAPVDREVETGIIASEAIGSRRLLYYPIIESQRGRMTLGAVSSPGELHPGRLGIPQPHPCEALEPGELGAALVCVPGLAFTAGAARLGRGGGYYDRMIAALPEEAVTIGLAYSFQLLDRLPEHDLDRRLDYVVTESAVYSASGAPHAAAQTAGQGGS
jgi:5-formyltetrahydrofolate cyclo-ligase